MQHLHALKACQDKRKETSIHLVAYVFGQCVEQLPLLSIKQVMLMGQHVLFIFSIKKYVLYYIILITDNYIYIL